MHLPRLARVVGDVGQVLGDGQDTGAEFTIERRCNEANEAVCGGADAIFASLPFGDLGFVGVEVTGEFFAAAAKMIAQEAKLLAG